MRTSVLLALAFVALLKVVSAASLLPGACRAPMRMGFAGRDEGASGVSRLLQVRGGMQVRRAKGTHHASYSRYVCHGSREALRLSEARRVVLCARACPNRDVRI
jgi:hypothetical protein